MSQDEVAALARAFSAHLAHLRDFRGLRYVGASPLPTADDASVEHAPAGEGQRAGAEQAAVSAEQAAVSAEPAVVAQRRDSQVTPAAQRREPQPTPAAPPTPTAPPAPAGQPAPAAPPAPAAQPAPAARTQGTPPAAKPTAPARAAAGQWSAARKLAYLRDRNVGDCQRCRLAQTRQQLVFGVGSPEARLMFIGEAPGAEEDRRGEPFVGAAGQRLDHWIRWLGFSREQVYIANVLKCRPPRNRDPHPVEIERCSPFLRAQIRAIEPQVIVALGRFAGCLLLNRDQPMYQMRGRVHRYIEPKTERAFPLVVTYHPSYVLRRERESQGRQGRPDRGGSIKSEDQKVLEDLSRAAEVLGLQRAR